MTNDIEITQRPFLGELLTPASIPTTPAVAQPNEPGPRRVLGNQHLITAATGRTPLRAVEQEEATPPHARSFRSRDRSDDRDRQKDWISPEGYLEVDWALVAELTRELTGNGLSDRSRGDFDVASASAGPETDAEKETMEQIQTVIERRATRIVQERGADHDWTPLQRGHYAQAIFDQAHRYGRLQQFLREQDVEEISIVGHDNVIVTKGTGKKEPRPAVASSDDELEQMIAELASYRGRSFARPAGDIDLDIGGARISATGRGKTSVTNLSIRKHNHVDITLADMVENRTITAPVSEFLAAASRANLCVFVAGFPGTGKTTLVRALTSTISPEEKIVTIETEHELYLNKLPHRHWQVMDLQYVPPQAAGADSAGGFTLQACLDKALRAGSERIIFAEIKSIEGPIAMKAMQAGKGSMSTIHARSADDAIHRFANVLMGELSLSDDTVPLRQILRSIDVIVYIDIVPNPDGTRRRVVTEVTEVRPTDHGTPMAAQLFRYDPAMDDYVTPEQPTTQLDERLRRVGYDFARQKRRS